MTKEYLLNEQNMSDIVEQVQNILDKRKANYERYARHLPSELKVPLEYYIDNIGTGYFGGKAPKYTIKQETNESKKETIKRLLDKEVGKNADRD